MKKIFLTLTLTLAILVTSPLLSVGANGVPVQVEPLEGEVFSAVFSGFDGEKALLKATDTPLPAGGYTAQMLKTIEFQNDSIETQSTPETQSQSESEAQSICVSVGDSILQASSVTKSAQEFQLTLLATGTTVGIPQNNVQQIVFQKIEHGKNPRFDTDWSEIQELETHNDILVVQRNGKLNYYYGTVLEITESLVRFQQDDDALNVKLKYVFALRFASAKHEDMSQTVLGTLTDTCGDSIFVSKLSVQESKVAQLTTVEGVSLTLPVSALKTFNFTSDSTVFLADLTPETVKWTPFFSLGDENQKFIPSTTKAFYAPKMNRGFHSKTIALDGKEYTQGMELSSDTHLIYRIPGNFKTFQATVGIDDSVRPRGSANVTILADDRILFEGEISGKDASKALKLPVSGARRLTIIVDHGKCGSYADYVAFADAKLVK